jgi:hypothetical protein
MGSSVFDGGHIAAEIVQVSKLHVVFLVWNLHDLCSNVTSDLKENINKNVWHLIPRLQSCYSNLKTSQLVDQACGHIKMVYRLIKAVE